MTISFLHNSVISVSAGVIKLYDCNCVKECCKFFYSLFVPLFTIILPVAKIQITAYSHLMLICLCLHIWYKTFTDSVTKDQQSFLKTHQPLFYLSENVWNIEKLGLCDYGLWYLRESEACQRERVLTEFCQIAFQPKMRTLKRRQSRSWNILACKETAVSIQYKDHLSLRSDQMRVCHCSRKSSYT